jgi:predicted metal-dependent hydrolase
VSQKTLKLPDGELLVFCLQRSERRKSIGLKIDHHGLTVVLPARAPESEAERAIRSKLDWILAKLPQRPAAPEGLRHGASIFWLGSPRVLVAGASRARLTPEHLHLAAPDEPARLAMALAKFLHRSARDYLPQRVAVWSGRMGLIPQTVSMSSARSRWGSCTSAGAVRLNWRLMQAAPDAIDYVVIHELAHLAELNHSPRFWAIVAEHCPDWKKHRDWLKANGAALLHW